MRLVLIFCLVYANTMLIGQESVKVISFNISGGETLDSLDHWENRKEKMCSFFLEEAPDFLGLQEIYYDQIEFLNECLPNYSYLGIGSEDGRKEGEFCPILFNDEKWEFLDFQTMWFSNTPFNPSKGWDAEVNRQMTIGRFRNKVSMDTLIVANTQLDQKGEESRKNSVKNLYRWIRIFGKGKEMLLLGNLNIMPRDPLHDVILKNFVDSKNAAKTIYEEFPGTFNDFNKEGKFNSRLDYIYFDKRLLGVSYECYSIHSKGRQLSDHFPVIARFKLIKE